MPRAPSSKTFSIIKFFAATNFIYRLWRFCYWRFQHLHTHTHRLCDYLCCSISANGSAQRNCLFSSSALLFLLFLGCPYNCQCCNIKCTYAFTCMLLQQACCCCCYLCLWCEWCCCFCCSCCLFVVIIAAFIYLLIFYDCYWEPKLTLSGSLYCQNS